MGQRGQDKRDFFRECGRRGGQKRARHLSPHERSMIASRAATTRWGKTTEVSISIASVRLDQPRWDDPVYLEEVLSEGSLADWGKLYRMIADRPFGSTTVALEKVLSSTHIYGVTPLWKGMLKTAQGVV